MEQSATSWDSQVSSCQSPFHLNVYWGKPFREPWFNPQIWLQGQEKFTVVATKDLTFSLLLPLHVKAAEFSSMAATAELWPPSCFLPRGPVTEFCCYQAVKDASKFQSFFKKGRWERVRTHYHHCKPVPSHWNCLKNSSLCCPAFLSWDLHKMPFPHQTKRKEAALVPVQVTGYFTPSYTNIQIFNVHCSTNLGSKNTCRKKNMLDVWQEVSFLCFTAFGAPTSDGLLCKAVVVFVPSCIHLILLKRQETTYTAWTNDKQ